MALRGNLIMRLINFIYMFIRIVTNPSWLDSLIGRAAYICLYEIDCEKDTNFPELNHWGDEYSYIHVPANQPDLPVFLNSFCKTLH